MTDKQKVTPTTMIQCPGSICIQDVQYFFITIKTRQSIENISSLGNESNIMVKELRKIDLQDRN